MLKLDSKTDTRILLDAISNDKIHLARFILDALDGKIIDSETDGAQTPLVSAVFLQDSEARSRFMNLLLQRGASVNRPDESGRTPLSYACEMGFLDAVKILVENGADPEAADSWGNTPLMYAVVARRPAVVEFLVRAFKRLGLQIDRQNKVGNSAVEVAKHLGHTECLQALRSLSRRIHDDALAERLSTVSIDEDEKPSERKAPPEDGTRLHGGLTRKKSLGLRNRIQSMDSIEEYERESDAFSSQGLVFSSKPPHKHADDLRNSSNHLLPGLFYSPRPFKTPWRSFTPDSPPSGPLGILLTPFGSKSAKEELAKAKKHLPVRRFDDRYYQKRCSLPTSALAAAAAPERSKSKSQRKSPGNRSVSALGGRLLRRFTFPELKRSGGEACGSSDPPGHSIPRSETFPLGKSHPQVGSKPSIDSISAVKCEFDFQCKAAPNCVSLRKPAEGLNRARAAVKPTADDDDDDDRGTRARAALQCGVRGVSERTRSSLHDGVSLRCTSAARETEEICVQLEFLQCVRLDFSVQKRMCVFLVSLQRNCVSQTRWTKQRAAPDTIEHNRNRVEQATLINCSLSALSVSAEQEVENLSGLSANPDREIFVVRENETTCLMAEFAVKFLIPYDVLALNGIDLITEQASVSIPRGAQIAGKCGNTESELHISWINHAFTFRIFFSKEKHTMGSDGKAKETDVWKMNKVQLVYDTSEKTHFINAYNPGKHTASTHLLSALVTPAGRSYVCSAQQTLTMISSDHQKGVSVFMYDTQIQPFDIASDFVFSELYI
ncbi:lysosome-associated membrane glycoprotein 5 [Pimephales promelas]|uniref:lysosome-associated membrane glycoprotein 5 n=1 Tax=Pimephales promelas TaxID=90988 RepID=UPI0019554DFB|nr:lysosome-associated membrane glycoprotein 5 [Pimephales promelas]